ncbi:MAG: YqgE/AlgH family protein [Chitinophagaceae bacterium]|nr:MAG: YqgE/AlgH family protein [Chitinophagaceae bacterium]
MQVTTGIFLRSTSSKDDIDFYDAIIFIVGHDDAGSTGFIVNRRFHRALNELEQYQQGRAFPIYHGGPVAGEKLYFIHKRPDLIVDGSSISNTVFLGGDFETAVAAVNDDLLAADNVKIFIGYCGWDHGELEAEIADGHWETTHLSIEQLFSDSP